MIIAIFKYFVSHKYPIIKAKFEHTIDLYLANLFSFFRSSGHKNTHHMDAYSIYIKLITITLMTIIFKVSFKAEDTITGKKIALPDITKHTKSFFACLPPDCFRIIHHITKAKESLLLFLL